MTAPNSAERRACWGARDDFWKCLDDNSESKDACQKFHEEFQERCPAQWVKYFMKRRDFLKYQERIQSDGYESQK